MLITQITPRSLTVKQLSNEESPPLDQVRAFQINKFALKLSTMNIIAKQGKILEENADLLVMGVWSGTQSYQGIAARIDKALGGLITVLTAEEDFGGKFGDELVLHTHAKFPFKRVMLVGLGDKKQFNLEIVRRLAGKIVAQATKINSETVSIQLVSNGLDLRETAKAFVEGALLADYRYLSFKPQEAKLLKKRKVPTFEIIDEEASAIRSIEKGIAAGEIFARATIYARDLVNEPSGNMTPTHLKEHAERIAGNCPQIKLKVLDAAACAKLGMEAYLAVAKGSDEPPYFLHLTYRPDASNKKMKKITLIGKGVTFDSGGLSLKPGGAMETMKCDMAGAAAVLGVFSVLEDLCPNVEVHGIIAACENMPSGKAVRPGDIVTAMNGKTIEILNTDAEGRLTLADAMSYAVKKIEPEVIVDLATLTGACVVALGDDIAGLMSNEKKISSQLLDAADASGEPLWPLPLPDDYAALVCGDHSDLRNTQRGKYGGAITAGLFLKEFVSNIPWAHLDIAGPAFAEKNTSSYIAKGGTGYGVRTLLNWLKNF